MFTVLCYCLGYVFLEDELFHEVFFQSHFGKVLSAHVDLREHVLIAFYFAPRVDVANDAIDLKIGDLFFTSFGTTRVWVSPCGS